MKPNPDAPHWLDADLAHNLVERFGTPLYVYHEGMLRRRLRELAGLLAHRPFRPSISVKANGNPWLLAIAGSEIFAKAAMYWERRVWGLARQEGTWCASATPEPTAGR